MKILQINTTCNWGSHGRIAEDIGKLAIDNGWESYIAYGRYELDSSSMKIKIGTKVDYLAHALLTRITDRTGFYSKRATIQFIKRLDKIKPDIIHLHNIHGYYINIELLFEYINKNNIPLIWTLHDCWSFTGHCSHFDYIGCNRWKKQCYECSQKGAYPASHFLDNSRRNYIDKERLFRSVKSLQIIPVSHWLYRLVKESFWGDKYVKVIHNGIDIELFKPTENSIRERYCLSDKAIILGVASVWDNRKGLNDFIELSKLVELDNVIVLIGIDDKMKKILPQNIIAINRTNSVSELAEWYSTADVFINPTWEDNFPTTNLEALACGTPVITYDTGGSIEAVDINTGLVVEKGNISGLVKAIDTILKNGKTHYLEVCRQRAVDNFNKQDRFQDYINMYNEIITQNK